jgi:hypothetical protein
MFNNIFKNINNFLVIFFDFVSFRKKNPIINNDIESCCILLNDDTNTCSE